MDYVVSMQCMPDIGNIVITDESAYHFLMHNDASKLIGESEAVSNPLDECACGIDMLSRFNCDHPLYGGAPVKLLVSNARLRRKNRDIECRYSACDFPRGSFFKLRDGLYVATPQLVFARMANYLTKVQLIELGYSLCGRYFIDYAGDYKVRRSLIATPELLGQYAQITRSLRGCGKATSAARFVKGNTGSPMETKAALLFCLPLWMGGFGLPFTSLNYDVRAGRCSFLTEQNDFCVDLAAPGFRFAAEFDGKPYHVNSGKDKRRRNALTALGWTVFAYEADVLYDPTLTEKLAYQMAKRMSYRIQKPKRWDDAYIRLRRDLRLPVL